jgi:hypothetical protein
MGTTEHTDAKPMIKLMVDVEGHTVEDVVSSLEEATRKVRDGLSSGHASSLSGRFAFEMHDPAHGGPSDHFRRMRESAGCGAGLREALLRAVRHADYVAGGDASRDCAAEVVEAGLRALLATGMGPEQIAEASQFDADVLRDLEHAQLAPQQAIARGPINRDVAEDAFLAYDFGDGVQVIRHNNWTYDGDTMTKAVFVEYPEDGPDDDTHEVSFSCRFAHEGVLVDVSALDCRTGNEVGMPAMSERPAPAASL